jgi:predicted transport protein
MTLDEFFRDASLSRKLFEALAAEIERFGKASVRVTKSQVAFRRKKNVAVVWLPGKYLKPPVAPLVLALSFPKRDDSHRWKQITQVAPKRFTHHLELHALEDIDAQVRGWLHEAWEGAA